MNKMVKKDLIPEFDKDVYATYFSKVDGMFGYDIGITHEDSAINSYSGRVLGGARFGGMFEVVDSPLSVAETRVLALRALGVSTDRICSTLGVREGTIMRQHKMLSRKLGVNSIAKALATAFTGEEQFFVPYMRGEATEKITKGQELIIVGLAQGLDIKEIADSLGNSVATVRTHIKRTYNKMNIPGDNYSSLVTYAHLTDALSEHDQTVAQLPFLDESKDIA